MDYGLTVGGPSFTCSCALKAKNASLHEREIALDEKKKKNELRESWKELASSLLTETTNWRVHSKAVIKLAQVQQRQWQKLLQGYHRGLIQSQSGAEKEAERCRVSETEATGNWKKLRRSSTSYKNAMQDWLSRYQSRQQKEKKFNLRNTTATT